MGDREKNEAKKQTESSLNLNEVEVTGDDARARMEIAILEALGHKVKRLQKKVEQGRELQEKDLNAINKKVEALRERVEHVDLRESSAAEYRTLIINSLQNAGFPIIEDNQHATQLFREGAIDIDEYQKELIKSLMRSL